MLSKRFTLAFKLFKTDNLFMVKNKHIVLYV